MAGYVTTIINAMETVIEALVNTKKDSLDNTISDIASNAIVTWHKEQFPEKFPLIEIYQMDTTPLQNILQENTNITIDWNIVTRISVMGAGEQNAFQMLDVWLTAVFQSVITGQSQSWNLDGNVCQVIPQSWEIGGSASGTAGTVMKEGAILWAMQVDYDPTS